MKGNNFREIIRVTENLETLIWRSSAGDGTWRHERALADGEEKITIRVLDRSSPWVGEEIHNVQFSSVARSCPTLCDPIDCSMPGLPVYHKLQEFTQTDVHWVSDAIQTSHTVFPFSSRLQSFTVSGSFLLSQFFKSDGQSIGVSASASVLPINI